MSKGVPFSMPLFQKTNEPVEQEPSSAYNAEILEIKQASKLIPIQSQSKKKTTKYTDVNDPNSFVLIEGEEAVAALFEFLVNYSFVDDVPTLYATVPFVNGSLQQAVVKSNGKRVRENSSKSYENAYSIELSGPLLPVCMMQLCELFKKTQKKTSFTGVFQTEKTTQGFNYCHGEPTSDDLEKQSSPFGKQVIKRVVYENEMFNITTA